MDSLAVSGIRPKVPRVTQMPHQVEAVFTLTNRVKHAVVSKQAFFFIQRSSCHLCQLDLCYRLMPESRCIKRL